MLANIMIFQDTMIVTEDMAEFDQDWMDEQQEEELRNQNAEYLHEHSMEEMYSLEDFLDEQRETDEELEAQREAIEEKKRKRDEQLAEFWNHVADKFHDNDS